MNQQDVDSRGWDAIVIGSGVGGLGAAAWLAEVRNWKVLVLEAHSQPGGFTHTFSRQGFEWDTGLHYVGGVQHPRNRIRKIFDRLSGGRLEWADTGGVIDRFSIGESEFIYPRGREAWKTEMLKAFPSEERAIDRYLELVDKVVMQAPRYFSERAVPRIVAMTAGPFLRAAFLRLARRSLAEVLEELSPDPLFRAVLAAQWGDHGLPPSKASFAIHALVFAHYLEGAGYPVGGSGAIAPAMIPTFEHKGGRLLTRARVEEILLQRGRVVGVRTDGGREYFSSRIISDTGLPNTLRMLPEHVPGRERLERLVEKLGISSGHCCLHLGLDAAAEELGLPRANHWIYSGPDFDGNTEKFIKDPSEAFPLLFISFPSAKDPDFTRRHPGKSTIEMTIPAAFATFEDWADQPPGKKGPDYEARKAEISSRLLKILYRHYPHLEAHVVFTDLSTPLTTRFFCHYERGEIYGLEHTPERFQSRLLRPRTPIPGLWLTGQDACTAGIAGALLGATLCASAVTGRNLMKN